MTDQPDPRPQAHQLAQLDGEPLKECLFLVHYGIALPDGRFALNPLQLLCELEILKINLEVLIQVACAHGMNAVEFDQAALAALNARAAALEGGPKLAVAPAQALR